MKLWRHVNNEMYTVYNIHPEKMYTVYITYFSSICIVTFNYV